MLVQDFDEAEPTTVLPDGVLCRIQILKTGSLDATIELDGTISEVCDARLENLFEALGRAEELSKGDDARRRDSRSWDYEVGATGKDGGA